MESLYQTRANLIAFFCALSMQRTLTEYEALCYEAACRAQAAADLWSKKVCQMERDNLEVKVEE